MVVIGFGRLLTVRLSISYTMATLRSVRSGSANEHWLYLDKLVAAGIWQITEISAPVAGNIPDTWYHTCVWCHGIPELWDDVTSSLRDDVTTKKWRCY